MLLLRKGGTSQDGVSGSLSSSRFHFHICSFSPFASLALAVVARLRIIYSLAKGELWGQFPVPSSTSPRCYNCRCCLVSSRLAVISGCCSQGPSSKSLVARSSLAVFVTPSFFSSSGWLPVPLSWPVRVHTRAHLSKSHAPQLGRRKDSFVQFPRSLSCVPASSLKSTRRRCP